MEETTTLGPSVANMESASPLPIAAAPGGFSSSFLRRQRSNTATSSLPQPLINSPGRPRTVTGPSPVRRKPLPSNASPVILPGHSQAFTPSHAPESTAQLGQIVSPQQLETVDEIVPFVPFVARDLDR